MTTKKSTSLVATIETNLAALAASDGPPDSGVWLSPTMAQAERRSSGERFEVLRALDDIPESLVARLAKEDREVVANRFDLLGIELDQWSALRAVEERARAFPQWTELDELVDPAHWSSLHEALQGARRLGVPQVAFKPLTAKRIGADGVSLEGEAVLPVLASFEDVRGILNPTRWPVCVTAVKEVKLDQPIDFNATAWEVDALERVNLVTKKLPVLDVECRLHFKYSSSNNGPWGRIAYALLPVAGGLLDKNEGFLSLVQTDPDPEAGCIARFTKTVKVAQAQQGWMKIYEVFDTYGLDRLTSAWLVWAQGICQ